LSAFTHLWNPIGYPAIHHDEGHYMRRALHVLDGLSPEELESGVARSYDHPYFGQLFLATVFGLIGYPDSLNPSPGNVQSIEMLYLVPRILMGILAVADTFLIYKIAERKYNRKVAFVAAILFAVMPMSWFVRRIFLESIGLPLLLLSILFAIYLRNPEKTSNRVADIIRSDKKILLILLSGIFLGLAIFTKFPAVTMIPLVAYLIYTNNKNNKNKRSLKQLGLWFIPVIIVPAIWPAYALSIGQFDNWLDGFVFQTSRPTKPLVDTITILAEVDPILLLLGLSGIVFSVIKRDFILLLWIIPYLVFLQIIDYVSYWNFILLLPALFISSSSLLFYFFDNLKLNRKIQKILAYAGISVIGVYGLTSTYLLITTNITEHYFETVAFIDLHLPGNSNFAANNSITLIGNRYMPGFSWILDQVSNNSLEYEMYYKIKPIKTDNVFLIIDRAFIKYLASNDVDEKFIRAFMWYAQSHTVAKIEDKTSQYPRDIFPYTSMKQNIVLENIELRRNY
jgi:Dolichyl-phosphate-mannose-protein mannosyltransferase